MIELGELTQQELLKLLKEVGSEKDRRKYSQLDRFFPEKGDFARHLYPKHLEFFEAGKEKTERVFMAGNRTGKTTAAAYEIALHATGEYPSWWKGRRFTRGVKIVCAGDTAKTTREIIQDKLIGPVHDMGSGMIPKDKIIDYSSKLGVPGALDQARVKHKSGHPSTIIFKSYDQKRESFQGFEAHVAWVDEECPDDIYYELIIRTMTVSGIVVCTFTPLRGMTPLILDFIEKENKNRSVIQVGWDDVPHLSEKAKETMLASTPEYLRDARTKGIPQLGSGAIYPVPESEIVVEPFAIPKHWMRGYGMDVGWNNTACVWGAHDKDNDIVYIYGEYKRGNAEPSIHASAIKARGNVNGFIDPASRGRSQVDGNQLVSIYRDLGLNVMYADNSVESGIYKVWERLSTGRLKIFSNMSEILREYRLYRRDKNGKVVKSDDHLMDSMRYAISKLDHFSHEAGHKKLELYTNRYMAENVWML